ALDHPTGALGSWYTSQVLAKIKSSACRRCGVAPYNNTTTPRVYMRATFHRRVSPSSPTFVSESETPTRKV
ncbi:hypothetical protein EMPG_10066, partial [Blastomyces silverae]